MGLELRSSGLRHVQPPPGAIIACMNTAIAAIIVGTLALIGTVVTAILGARTAGRTSRLQAALQGEIEKEKLLESRVGAVKREMYLPLIRALVAAMNTDQQNMSQRRGRKGPQQDNLLTAITDHFPNLLTVGSDGAIRVFGHLMQAAFNDAPGTVFLRLWADFIMEARKDLRGTDTEIDALTLLSCKISDLYSNYDSFAAATVPLNQLAADVGWEIPWQRSPIREPQLTQAGEPSAKGEDRTAASAASEDTDRSRAAKPPLI